MIHAFVKYLLAYRKKKRELKQGKQQMASLNQKRDEKSILFTTYCGFKRNCFEETFLFPGFFVSYH